jgi:hypothetical protein
MSPAKAASPTCRGSGMGARKKVGFGRLDGHQDGPRPVRRQRLAKHLHACGPRPVLEALLAVAVGNQLDRVLEDFARLAPKVYWALGADRLAIDDLLVTDGGGP